MHAELLRLPLAEGGGRLIQTQQLRPAAQRLRDLDQLPVASTETVRGHVGSYQAVELLENLSGLSVLRGMLNPEANAHLVAEEYVVGHGK
jgi:hypothetical protein